MPDRKDDEVRFYVGPEITFLGKATELTAGWCSPVAEGYGGSGKYYNANPPGTAAFEEGDEGKTETDETRSGEDESESGDESA